MDFAVKSQGVGEKEDLFNQLIGEILNRRQNPEDMYEVVAILESMGWSDELASDVYGKEDVFALSAEIWDIIHAKILYVPTAPVEKLSPLQYIMMVLRSFLRGTIFALPMAVSVASMLTLRYSLWSYQYLSLENATGIAIGTILSFMAIGGFTQAIARRGFMYIGQGHYYMARKVAFYFVRLGYAVCLLGALSFLVFSSVFSVYPWRMTIIIIVYFLFLSAIWLSVTIMYMLQKEMAFTGLMIGGIFTVFILFDLVGLNIILSQVIALTLVSLTGIIAAHYYFLRAEKKMDIGIAPPMPRLSIVVYTSIPYFLYGFLYFTFLFIDRIVAWSTNNVYMPYLVWFRGEYELGLDFALISLILPMGLVEVVVNDIMSNLEANQKNFMAADNRRLGEMYVRIYIKRLAYTAVFSLLNACILYFVLKTYLGDGVLELNVFTHHTTHFVFVWALLSYAIVAVALMNALILFCLSQPEMAYRPLLYSLVVNLCLGFVLSRWIDYSWAVIGLMGGALVFVCLTTRMVLQVMKNLDYYLYYAS